MATNLPPDVVPTLLAAVVYRNATLDEIAAAFPDPPARSTAKTWTDALITDGLVGIDDRAKPFVYFATHAGAAYYREHCTVISGAIATPAAPPSAPSAPTNPDAAALVSKPALSLTPALADPAVTASPRPAGAVGPALGAGADATVSATLGVKPAVTTPPEPVDGAGRGAPAGSDVVGDPAGDHAKSAGDHAGDAVGDPPAPEPSPEPSPAIAGAIAGLAGAPAGTDAGSLKPLFEGVVHPIIAGVLPRASALALLQTWPSPELADPALRSRFVQYGMGRLEHLTLGECIGLGLQPGQYELWRRQYFETAEHAISAPAANGSGATPPAGTGGSGAQPAVQAAGPLTKPAAGSKSAGAAHRDGADQPPPASGADLVAGVLAPLLSAVLPAPPGMSAPAGMTSASAGIPAGTRRSAPNPAINAATTAALKRLIESLGRQTGGVNPVVTGMWVAGASALIVWVAQMIAGSVKLGLVIAACFVVGWLLWQWRRAAANDQGPETRDQGPGTRDQGLPIISRSGFHISPFWLVLALAALALIAGALWYRRAQRPPDSAIRDYLVTTAAPLPVRIASLAPTVGNLTGTSCPVTYQAVFETTAPLYRRIDAAEYLRTHAPAEFSAISAAAALLAGPDGGQLRAALGATAPASSNQGPGTSNQGLGTRDQGLGTRDQGLGTRDQGPGTPHFSSLVLVTTATPAGASVLTSGVLLAWKREAGWGFTPQQGGLDRSRFAGEPKPTEAFAVELPADATRLNAWLGEEVAYAAKVQAAATAFAAQRERARQQQAVAFTQLLRPGTLFTGTITDPIRATSQRIILEITTAPGQAIAALLRNDGGWSDARPFSGSWALNPTGDAAVVTLRTSRSDAINDAGPLLQDRLDWTLTLTVAADGSAVAGTGGAGSPLRRIDPTGAAAIRADVLQPLAPAIAATAPGLVYRGTATARIGGAIEPLLLRFLTPTGTPTNPPAPGSPAGGDAPNRETTEIRATLESATTAGQVRAFRGTLVSDTYRVGDTPIRLQSADSQRAATANPRSVLGINTTNDGLAPALRADGVRLTGQDAWFTYAFTPAPAPGAAGADDWPPAAPSTPESGAGNPPSAPGSTLLTPPLLATAAALEPGIAYARIAGRWVPLPHNNGHEVKRLVQVLSGWLSKITTGEAKLAGQDPKASDSIVGELVFDGTDPVPQLPGADVLVVYVGGITPRSQKQIAAYPTLLLEPPLEVAPMQRLDSGARYTLLNELVPNVKYFGPRRVDVVIDRPQPTVTVFRPRAPLTPGPYALNCSGQTFEFQVP